jgi:hypothetical protein
MSLTMLHMDCSDIGIGRSDCEDQTTQAVQRSIGTAIYTKATDAEMAAAKAAGNFKEVAFASFSTKVTSSSKGVATLSPPVPTTILPGPHDRYTELTKQPMTWNTTLQPSDGGPPFPVVVTVRYAGQQGDLDLIELTNAIPVDTDGSYYARSPMPYQITQYIDTQTRDVRQILVTGYFHGDCDGRGQVALRFQLCSKTTGSKVEGTPCP